MDSVSFLSLCKVSMLSVFDRMARNLQQRMIAACEVSSSMEPASPYPPRRRRVTGASAILSTVARARTNTKQPVRESFKPPRDLAVHTDD
jgi:hypothetical protein